MKYLKNFFSIIDIVIVSSFSYLFSFILKRRNTSIAVGSWCGELYNDNSKYFVQYLLKYYPNINIYWVGNKCIKDELPKNVKFLKLNSLYSVYILLQCKYMFFVQMHRADISKYNVYRNAILCCFDHGIPIKKWAMDDPNYTGNLEYKNFSILKKIYTKINGENKKYDYITVSSDKGVLIYESALKYRMNESSQILRTGTPRNDFLINIKNPEIQMIRKKIAEKYHFDYKKIIISYLPTYRRNVKKIESFMDRTDEEMRQISNLLDKYNAVLLEKNHFASDKFTENHQSNTLPNIIKIDKPIDFQELLLATDVQIADYSGGYLDYTLLDRPIIHYLYDFEEYKNNDSGLYYELDEFAAGKVVYDFESLIDELDNVLQGLDHYSTRRNSVRNSILQYEDGHACEKVCKILFK